MTPTNVFYPTIEDETHFNQILLDIYAAGGGARNYQGKGIAIKSLQVEGPLTDGWPPKGTRDLLATATVVPTDEGTCDVILRKSPIEHVADVVSRIAPRAFRRPPLAGELEAFINLAEPAIAEGRAFTEVIRIPLRAILSSPQFLLFAGESGRLNDYALASRLSYFLWKSIPDEELLALAQEDAVPDRCALATSRPDAGR